jgi:DNA-binding IclR family transcriptional regulator
MDDADEVRYDQTRQLLECLRRYRAPMPTFLVVAECDLDKQTAHEITQQLVRSGRVVTSNRSGYECLQLAQFAPRPRRWRRLLG